MYSPNSVWTEGVQTLFLMHEGWSGVRDHQLFLTKIIEVDADVFNAKLIAVAHLCNCLPLDPSTFPQAAKVVAKELETQAMENRVSEAACKSDFMQVAHYGERACHTHTLHHR